MFHVEHFWTEPAQDPVAGISSSRVEHNVPRGTLWRACQTSTGLFHLLGQGSHCGSAALHRQVKNVVVEWAGTCGRQLAGYDGCVSSGGAVPFVVERGGREMKRAYKSGATSAVDGVIHRTSLLAA